MDVARDLAHPAARRRRRHHRQRRRRGGAHRAREPRRRRQAVAGLNPHAGDGGSLGREEIDVIAPAIEAARGEGIDARGPLSPDTVFVAARRGDFDAVVSMFHDRGQIAMKLMGFESGVTLHGGLPVPVATCASGTAFDIVGRPQVRRPASGRLTSVIPAPTSAAASANRRLSGSPRIVTPKVTPNSGVRNEKTVSLPAR